MVTQAEKKIFPFSPFPPAMMWEKRNRSLLIQFIIAALISAYRELLHNATDKGILSHEKRFFPYDWAYPYGHLNKVREHAMILEHVFPELEKQAMQFKQLLDKVILSLMGKTLSIINKAKKSLPEIFLALEPFIEGCKENENLIFFLLQQKEEIDLLIHPKYLYAFLVRLHPTGLAELCEKLCDNYHHRGFYFLIPEIKRLIAKFDYVH